MTTVSVVICTRNRPHDLERALASLAWQSHAVTQMIVVDDSDPGRRHETEARCDAVHLDVTLLRKDEPGLTASRNLAIEHVTGELTMFFDDDVVLRPDYVEQMVATFRNDPAIAGAGGSIDDDHRYELPALRGLLMIPGRTTGRVYPSGWSSQSPRDEDRVVEHLIGCNMVFRTAVLLQYRFDDRFRGYALGEDLQFTHRLHLDGHRLVSVGGARLWHLTGLPKHDRNWGYREVVIRPIVAGRRFRTWAFLISALAFAAVNRRRNPERAAGNLEAIRDVLRGDGDEAAQTETKELRAIAPDEAVEPQGRRG